MAYLDNNATTSIDPDVRRIIAKFYDAGNISANYNQNRKIRDLAARSVERWMGYPGCRVIFTSCASESNNMLIRAVVDYFYYGGASGVDSSGTDVRGTPVHVVTSSIEHETTIECLELLSRMRKVVVTYVRPDMYGRVTAEAVEAAMRSDTVLVTVMYANNELGTMNDVYRMAELCDERGVTFHSDAVQAVGKYSMNDVSRIGASGVHAYVRNISCSFHKIHGPIGLGCLVVSPDVFSMIEKYPHITGTQNYGLRGGTMPIQNIAAVPVILAKISEDRAGKNARMAALKGYLFDRIRAAGFTFVPYEVVSTGGQLSGPFEWDLPWIFSLLGSNWLPNTMSMCFPRLDNLKLQEFLASKRIYVSVGSACAVNRHSRVLKAIGAPRFVLDSTIRVSFSDLTTKDECDKFVYWLQQYAMGNFVVYRARQIGGV